MDNNLKDILNTLTIYNNDDYIDKLRNKYKKLTRDYIYLTYKNIDDVLDGKHIRYINKYGELRSGFLVKIDKGTKIEHIKLYIKNSYRTWSILLQYNHVFYKDDGSTHLRNILEKFI
jgi:hypothetical protein